MECTLDKEFAEGFVAYYLAPSGRVEAGKAENPYPPESKAFGRWGFGHRLARSEEAFELRLASPTEYHTQH
jgi:hypothetical protein